MTTLRPRRRAKPADRPVTFAFNGGPGISSVWLHLGLLGPRRVVMGDVGDAPPAALRPRRQRRVAASRVSDLVFIDPVSTGYSRAVEGGKPEAVPRVPGRPRVRRRGHPALDVAQQPLDVAEVPRRRVLRHAARRGAGRAPPGAATACTSTGSCSSPACSTSARSTSRSSATTAPTRSTCRPMPPSPHFHGKHGRRVAAARARPRPRRMPRATTRGCCPGATG